MKPRRPKTPYAVEQAVYDLIHKFEYPDVDTQNVAAPATGGKGMAHILIVSTSEPIEVQEKADFRVQQDNAGTQLNSIFSTLPASGIGWSIWMAGQFNLDVDVTFPSRAWIRGLGYTHAEVIPT